MSTNVMVQGKIPIAKIEIDSKVFIDFEQESKRIRNLGPSWLKATREAATNTHLLLGIPTHKHEEWRYTSLRGLESHEYKLSEATKLHREQITKFFYGSLKGPHIVLVNGVFDKELSFDYESVPGLKAMSLKDAIQYHPELVENHLTKIVDTSSYTFGALNTALFEDGVFLYVSKDTQLQTPVQVLYLSVPKEQPTYHHPRSLIILEDNSNAHIVETFASINDGITFTNMVTEISVGQGAIFEHIKVQRESTQAYHISLTQVKQERDSRFSSDNMTFGGALTRNDFNLWLDGEGIDSTLNGVYVGNGEQIIDNHTRMDHAKPHCHTFEVYKGILDDKATGVFNGKIYVHQDAQKTDAKQSNQAILLSKTATINTKPQLEIFADDVKCTHGATVGQLSKDALFYLQSRGLPEEDAKALLLHAFASEVIGKISLEEVRQGLESLLYEKLLK